MLRSNGFKNIYVVPLWFPFFNPGCSSSQPAQHGWGNPKFGGWEVSRFRSRIEFVFLPKVKSLQKEKMRQRMIVHKVKHLLWAAKKRHDFERQFWWWVVFTGWGLCNVTGHAWEGGFAQVLYIVIEKHWSDVHWCFNDSKQICQKLNTGSMGALAAQEMILLDSGERR